MPHVRPRCVHGRSRPTHTTTKQGGWSASELARARTLFVIVFSPLFTRRVHTVFASTRAYECLSAKINGQFVPGALSPVIIILSTVTRERGRSLALSLFIGSLAFDSTADTIPRLPPLGFPLFPEEFA